MRRCSSNKQIFGVFAGLAMICSMGCSESVNKVDDMSGACNGQCTDTQECRNGQCYEKCLDDDYCEGNAPFCQNGLCVPESALLCTVGTKKCNEDSSKVLKCNSDGEFDEFETCLDGSVCELGYCMSKACNNGDYRCNNNNVEKCTNNSFKIYNECDAGQYCDIEKKECLNEPDCKENDKRCSSSGNVEICRDGIWQGDKICPLGQSCDTARRDCAESAVCVNNVKECDGDDYKICINGNWELRECPGTTVCVGNGNCEAVDRCTDGATRCGAGNASVERCNNGKNETVKTCESGTQCVTVDNIADCKVSACPSVYKCDNNALYQCNASYEYELKKTCADSETCNAVKGECSANCGNNTLDEGEECDGSLFRTGTSECSSVTAGSDGVRSCDPTTCKVISTECKAKAECKDGEIACEGTRFKSCKSGVWLLTDCAGKNENCDVSKNGCYTPNPDADGWEHYQDFEGIKLAADYQDVNTVKDSKDSAIVFSVTGRTDGGGYAIGGTHAVVMTKKQDSANEIKIEGISKGVKKLSFDWRAWPKDAGSYDIKVGSASETLTFEKKDITQVDIWEASPSLDVKGNATIIIKPKDYQGTANTSRIIIDNIRWNDN